ncbi:MAG: LpqB family beta-propeller domain-containing protein, partial [Nocardioidaceae bacterium]
AQEYALRDIAVDLAGERVAAVSEDGTTVVLAPRGERADEVPAAQETEVLTDRGTDLLQPAWDVFGDLWLVDRTPDGARLSVRHDDSWARLDAPGLTGVDVSAFTVSRDGTRLVAVEERPSGDRLLMARVVRDAEGEVRALTRAEELPFDQGAIDEIRDVAWSAPGSLAVLTSPTPATTSVLPVLVDGSSSFADADPSAETLRHRADRLVASPSAEAPLYVADPGGELFELGPDGEWVGVVLDGPLRAPTYVG